MEIGQVLFVKDVNNLYLVVTGLDTKSEACQRFIKEGMTISYNKILLDDAVSTWKFEIHVSIKFVIFFLSNLLGRNHLELMLIQKHYSQCTLNLRT